MTARRSVCVYCGSRAGRDPRHRDAAATFGRALAARGLGLVYGGASVGLMGAVADAALEAGGHVTGIIPQVIVSREVAHAGLQVLERVDSMHERKTRMAECADAFVALPGGIGTLEELFEIWTWAQLGLHRKPVALLDVGGYYAPLRRFLDQMLDDGFVGAQTHGLLIADDDIERLIDRIVSGMPPAGDGFDAAPT